MSTGPRKAGQGARSTFNRGLRLAILVFVWAYVGSLVVAVFVNPEALLFYAITTPIVVVLFLYVFQRKKVKEVTRSLRAWRTGAIGEEQIGALLDSLGSQGYRVAHDVQTGRGNLDHVVVGPNGVFAIETKAASGKLWLKQGQLMKGNFSVEKWRSQAFGEALEVKKRIARVGLDVWVEAIVVVTRITLPKGPFVTKSVRLIESKDLLKVILERPGPRLSSEEVSRAIAAVQ